MRTQETQHAQQDVIDLCMYEFTGQDVKGCMHLFNALGAWWVYSAGSVNTSFGLVANSGKDTDCVRAPHTDGSTGPHMQMGGERGGGGG